MHARKNDLVIVGEPPWVAALSRLPVAAAPAVNEALLIDYPVEAGLRRQEWRHDLLREFQLITYGMQGHHEKFSVPRRLLALAEEMTKRFGAVIEQHTEALKHALAEGNDRVVLRYPLTASARALEIEFARAMEEADAYCREQALMTVAPTPETYYLRRWIAEEVVRQYDGYAPRPWAVFLADVAEERPDARASVPHASAPQPRG